VRAWGGSFWRAIPSGFGVGLAASDWPAKHDVHRHAEQQDERAEVEPGHQQGMTPPMAPYRFARRGVRRVHAKEALEQRPPDGRHDRPGNHVADGDVHVGEDVVYRQESDGQRQDQETRNSNAPMYGTSGTNLTTTPAATIAATATTIPPRDDDAVFHLVEDAVLPGEWYSDENATSRPRNTFSTDQSSATIPMIEKLATLLAWAIESVTIPWATGVRYCWVSPMTASANCWPPTTDATSSASSNSRGNIETNA